MRSVIVASGAWMLVLLNLGHASATLLTYSGSDEGVGPGGARPSSDAAAAAFDMGVSRRVVTFEGLPIGSFSSLEAAPGVVVTLDGTAADANAGITNIVGDVTIGYNTTSGGSQFLKFVPAWDVGTALARFDFASPIDAFGTYLTGLGTANGNLHVLFTDTSTEDIPVTGSSSGGVQFFGFTDANQQISSVTLQLSGVTGSRDIFGIDDVRVVATPEPSALILLDIGMLALLGHSWRRREFMFRLALWERGRG
jgi:hypothetical protein